MTWVITEQDVIHELAQNTRQIPVGFETVGEMHRHGRTFYKRGDQIARVKAFEKENGFKLADLAPKRAPIDIAMARKNTRGAQRPTRG